ncbi:hypothetical protein [Methanococcoides methylutens]
MFKGAQLENVTFDNAFIKNSNLDLSKIKNVTFKKSQLENVTFDNANV